MTDDRSITRIRAYAITPPDMPLARYTGYEDLETRDMEIVRITLANGVEGIGCCDTTSCRENPGSVVRDIRHMSAKWLGRSVQDPAAVTEPLVDNAGPGPCEGISIVDCAMWDALAQCEGKAVWKMLGGAQSRAETYASTAAHLTIDEYLDEVAECVELGYRAIKLHLYTEIEFDLELVRTVAKAHSDLRFMVDMEQASNFDDAVRLGRALDKLPYDWMEAPLPDTDLEAYVELNKAIEIDLLAAGNALVGMDNWSEGLNRQAWSRLRCDPTNAGGITTVRKGMALARSMNILTELQSFGFAPTQQANLHMMLGLGGCSYFEHPVPTASYEYAARNPLVLGTDGCVGASDSPGFGAEMDWDAIAADAFESFDSGMLG